jgi:AraC-like DNA-binding protein
VHYAEHPLPAALDGLVAAVWTAEVPDDAGADGWVEQEAVPDGCIELIRRHSGRSVWRREQPELFATGLATAPAQLRLGAGARFTGIKLWPWGWHALGGAPCPGFADDWIAIDDPALAALIEGAPEAIPARLTKAFAAIGTPPLGPAILGATTVADIARRLGMPHRRLQRAFARELGMPPRSYLRLLRFRDALHGIQAGAEPLADTAAAQGYADQAHMAREFRNLAGMPPSAARARAKGPFV